MPRVQHFNLWYLVNYYSRTIFPCRVVSGRARNRVEEAITEELGEVLWEIETDSDSSGADSFLGDH